MEDLTTAWDEFRQKAGEVHSAQELFQLKALYLGKKGRLTGLLKSLPSLGPAERPQVGAEVNQLKTRIESLCRDILMRLSEKRFEKTASRAVDVTLPGRECRSGRPHPITQTLEEIERIFLQMGFDIFEGPEVETDYYNFEALNIPPFHPARDMQDTFYINQGPRTKDHGPLLLRTHTSPVQIRVMEKNKPPIQMIAPGVVYRRDSDISHSPMFHQVEGLVVGEGIRFSDLKGVVNQFLKLFFRREIEVRFRPSYFPFTEPSAEVDLRSQDGKWLEIIGCGMVHENVFRAVRYDPGRVTGFAFGLGVERLAMIRWGIPDIRMFFENDLRFLEQF